MRNCIIFFIKIDILCLLIMGCQTPDIMLNHNLGKLKAINIDNTKSTDHSGQEIVLQIQGDLTTSPTGLYIDQHAGYSSQSYVTPKSGYVLFEKIADVLDEQNATVFREYFPQPRQVNEKTFITILVEESELHQWKTRQQKLFRLARAKVTYSISQPNTSTFQQTVELKAKVTSERDVFKSLARQFCNEINQHIARKE